MSGHPAQSFGIDTALFKETPGFFGARSREGPSRIVRHDHRARPDVIHDHDVIRHKFRHTHNHPSQISQKRCGPVGLALKERCALDRKELDKQAFVHHPGHDVSLQLVADHAFAATAQKLGFDFLERFILLGLPSDISARPKAPAARTIWVGPRLVAPVRFSAKTLSPFSAPYPPTDTRSIGMLGAK